MPSPHQRPDDVPDLVARPRIETGGGLVEEHDVGGDDDARGDVEAPSHSSRVVLDESARGVGEPERLEQLAARAFGVRPLQAEQPSEQDQVLAPGQVLVHRGELTREAHEPAHRVGLLDDVVAQNPRRAGVGEEQGWRHPDRGWSCPRRSARGPRRRSRSARRGRRHRRRGSRRMTRRGLSPRWQAGTGSPSGSWDVGVGELQTGGSPKLIAGLPRLPAGSPSIGCQERTRAPYGLLAFGVRLTERRTAAGATETDPRAPPCDTLDNGNRGRGPERAAREPETQPLELILARNLVSIVSLPAFLVDPGGYIVFFNEAAAEIIGSRFEETGRLSRAEWNRRSVPSTRRGSRFPPRTCR